MPELRIDTEFINEFLKQLKIVEAGMKAEKENERK
jgi:hypothetical protein